MSLTPTGPNPSPFQAQIDQFKASAEKTDVKGGKLLTGQVTFEGRTWNLKVLVEEGKNLDARVNEKATTLLILAAHYDVGGDETHSINLTPEGFERHFTLQHEGVPLMARKETKFVDTGSLKTVQGKEFTAEKAVARFREKLEKTATAGARTLLPTTAAPQRLVSTPPPTPLKKEDTAEKRDAAKADEKTSRHRRKRGEEAARPAGPRKEKTAEEELKEVKIAMEKEKATSEDQIELAAPAPKKEVKPKESDTKPKTSDKEKLEEMNTLLAREAASKASSTAPPPAKRTAPTEKEIEELAIKLETLVSESQNPELARAGPGRTAPTKAEIDDLVKTLTALASESRKTELTRAAPDSSVSGKETKSEERPKSKRLSQELKEVDIEKMDRKQKGKSLGAIKKQIKELENKLKIDSNYSYIIPRFVECLETIASIKEPKGLEEDLALSTAREFIRQHEVGLPNVEPKKIPEDLKELVALYKLRSQIK